MNNISLKAKILLLSVFMVTAAASVGIISFVFSQKTTNVIHSMIKEELPAMRSVSEMLLNFRLARIELLQLTSEGTTPEADAQSLKLIGEEWKNFDQHNKDYLSVSHNVSENEKKLYDDFIKEITTAREMFAKAIDLYKKNHEEGSAERQAMSKLVALDLAEQSIKVQDTAHKLDILQEDQMKEVSENAIHAADFGNLISGLVTVIGSLLSLSIAFIFSTRLARQMNRVIEMISISSQEVALASNEIADSSVKLSEASTEQAASLGETAASLEEITAMIAKAAESAVSAENSSVESQTKAEEGRRAVDQMLSSIEEISRSNEEIVTQVNSSNQQMAEIVRVIQEIGTKTKIINEIVFQTKLLSFNASVEAARAGEHGKGFAVVAEEVGNLAQMSGNAAKEITEMLDGSISKVENIVKESKAKVESLVESGKQKVEVGVETARQCSTVLDEIVHNVTHVSSLSQEISQASREQSQGVGEINKAMSQLDTVTQQNSATSEKTAHSAEQLSTQAVSLKSAVDELVVVIQGGAAQTNISAKESMKKSSAIKPAHKKTPHRTKDQNSSNVISLNTKQKKSKSDQAAAENAQTPASARETRMASGESFTPSRDDAGFNEE